jgi:hypothetical protein
MNKKIRGLIEEDCRAFSGVFNIDWYSGQKECYLKTIGNSIEDKCESYLDQNSLMYIITRKDSNANLLINENSFFCKEKTLFKILLLDSMKMNEFLNNSNFGPLKINQIGFVSLSYSPFEFNGTLININGGKHYFIKQIKQCKEKIEFKEECFKTEININFSKKLLGFLKEKKLLINQVCYLFGGDMHNNEQNCKFKTLNDVKYLSRNKNNEFDYRDIEATVDTKGKFKNKQNCDKILFPEDNWKHGFTEFKDYGSFDFYYSFID